MRWYEKMSEGMRLMKEACAENETWDKCWNCPFESVCGKLMILAKREGGLHEYVPAEWGEEEKE